LLDRKRFPQTFLHHSVRSVPFWLRTVAAYDRGSVHSRACRRARSPSATEVVARFQHARYIHLHILYMFCALLFVGARSSRRFKTLISDRRRRPAYNPILRGKERERERDVHREKICITFINPRARTCAANYKYKGSRSIIQFDLPRS